MVFKKIIEKKESIKNVLFVWCCVATTSISNFLLQVILARELTSTELGQLSTIQSIINILSIIPILGITQFWLIRFGIEGIKAYRWVSPSLKFIGIVTIGVIVFGYFYSLLWIDNLFPSEIFIIMIATLPGMIFSQVAITTLQVQDRFKKSSVVQMSPAVLKLGIIYLLGSTLFIQNYIDIKNITLVYFLIYVAIFAYSIYIILIFSKNINKKIWCEDNSINSDAAKISQVIARSYPMGLSVVFYTIYNQMPIILSAYLVSTDLAAVFMISNILMNSIYLFPSAFYQKYLQIKLYKLVNINPIYVNKVYKRLRIFATIFGILSVVIIFMIGDLLIGTIFGDGYKKSFYIIQVLSLAIPFHILSIVESGNLLTEDEIRLKMYVFGYAAIIFIATSILLNYLAGSIGVAWAVVFSEIFVFIGFARLNDK
jgi:O-antigen/teichoic acid export membrane protein